MNISYNWLKKYADFEWTPEELSDRLTLAGLEVEGLDRFDTIEGGLEGVVVGHVKAVRQHPNADKLRCCKVDVGGPELLDIVCGAPNVAEGQNVPVATVGTKLPTPDGSEFKIKKSKIRGEVSMGMICAEDELGLGQGHDGIMVLDENLTPGTPASDVFDIERDHILEIGLTPNRVDASSHFGVARDVAALNDTEAKLPELAELPQSAPVENPVSIELPEPDRCPRYLGLYFRGVTIQESPDWLKNRLKSIGLRPINNIVDITNFVLHELGHPMHAFDADTIAGNKIVVKTLPEDTPFTTLDDTERTIRAGVDLMICDGEKPVAVAGVMGGQNSEVSAETKNIFLEVAWFEPAGIRATAKYLGLKTDASYRFERGVDPNITLTAARRAAKLILELAGGEVSQPDDVKKREFPPFEIELDYAWACRLMGTDLGRETVGKILSSLEIEVEDLQADVLKLKVPAYRVDVTRPQDILEELLRIYGYNNVPLPQNIRLSMDLRAKTEPWMLLQKYFDHLAASGWQEMISNPLIPAKWVGDGAVPLINNLSEELAVLRDNMLHSGLEAIAYNHNRKNMDLRLFEYGKSYHQTVSNQNGTDNGHQENENEIERTEKAWIAYFLTGNTTPLHWSQKPHKVSFFTLGKEMERLQERFGFQGKITELEEDSYWDYGLCLMQKKQVVARYGKAKGSLCREWGIKTDVFFALVDWEVLYRLHGKKELTYTELPKFPSTSRDISMLVPDHLRYRDIRAAVVAANPKLVQNVQITDVYRGDKIETGKKSYLIHITLMDQNKTLTDKAADKLMERIFKSLEQELGAEVRR